MFRRAWMYRKTREIFTSSVYLSLIYAIVFVALSYDITSAGNIFDHIVVHRSDVTNSINVYDGKLSSPRMHKVVHASRTATAGKVLVSRSTLHQCNVQLSLCEGSPLKAFYMKY